METLAIEGKNFVKASKLARDYGYTSDYIGQLCRAGKVEAQLVGRSWYVEVSSLENHKASRYKKSGTKKVETQNHPESQVGYGTPIKVEEKFGAVAEEVEVEVLKSNESGKQFNVFTKRSVAKSLPKAPKTSTLADEKIFYNRLPKPLRPLEYDADDSELIPNPKHLSDDEKTGKIRVNLADASPVKITSVEDKYSFETTKRPEVIFSGELSVSALPGNKRYELPEEEEENVSEVEFKEEEKVEPTPVNLGKSKARPVSSVSPNTKVIHYKRQLPVVRGVSMKRKGKLNRNQTSDTLEVPVVDAALPEQSSNRMVLVVATLAAVFIVVTILGLETQLTVTSSVVIEQIGFSVDKLFASVYGSK